MPTTDKPKIFFSYAWGDTQEQGESREKIVNELYNSLKADGHNVVMDKHDLGYKGMITDFMKRIGKGQFVVVAISDKYLHSEYCMYELLEIYRKSNSEISEMVEKIFPIVLDDAKVYAAEDAVDLIAFWENNGKPLAKKLKKVNPANAIPQIENLRIRNEIASNIGALCNVLRDINTLTPALLSADNFSEIKKAIEERMASIEQVAATTPTPEAQTAPIPRHLTAPPFISKVFLGREQQLEILHKKLFEESNLLLLVNGKGGVGKTSLAAHYYHRYAGSYQHLAWVLSENSIANALLLLAEPLGLAFGETMNTEERLAALLTKMAALQKPCLLVIDNANEPEDLTANFVALKRCTNFHLLLTSRITNFTEAESWPIDGLPAAAALQLFKKYYPRHQAAEDDLFMAIHRAVDHNTLVVELLAKNLARLNSIQTHYTLADLLADLQGRGLLALSQSKAVETGYQAKGPGLRKEDPQAIIAAMYDLGELSQAEKKLLSNFAVLPAENIPFTILQTLLPTATNLEDTLSSLATKGWIEQFDAAFKISPVIQEITSAKNTGLLEDCGELIWALADKLNYEPGTGHFLNSSYQEAMLYARYGETAAGTIAQADYNIGRLLEYLGSYHQTTGNLPKALALYETCCNMCQQLIDTYPDDVAFKEGLAISFSKLGNTYTSMGNLSKAQVYYEECLRIGKELLMAYPNNVNFKYALQIYYEKLGNTYTKSRNLSKALNYYEDQNKLIKEIYEVHPENVDFKNGLAISYSKLGETYSAMGNLQEALRFFTDETNLFQQLYDTYPNNVGFKNGLAISYSKLGNTYSAMGNLQEALPFYTDYKLLRQQLYEAYPDNVVFKNGLALSYNWLGWFYEDKMKDKTKAMEYYLLSKPLLVDLVDKFPDFMEFTENLDWVNDKLA